MFLKGNKLTIKIVEATSLRAGDLLSADPLVKLKIKGKFRRSKKTKIIKDTRHPQWNEDFIFNIHKPDQIISLKVLDHFTFSKDCILGLLEIPLPKYISSPGVVHDEWFTLLKKQKNGNVLRAKGRLHLRIVYSIFTNWLNIFNEIDR